MKLFFLVTAIVIGFSAFSQTEIIMSKTHMIALLDQEDSKTLYEISEIEPVEEDGALIKTFGPEDKLVEVSCSKLDEKYSCFGMLKFYNLKEKEEGKYNPESFYFAAEVNGDDKNILWYKQLNLPEHTFGNGQKFKEFLSSDEGMFFNCRKFVDGKKICKLGIIIP